MNGTRRFFINGIIMTVTSLLLRGLGVAFNAFVTRRLGAGGMGLFTLIMSVYGLSVTAASAGVNLAATRMCAEALETGGEGRVRAVLRRCFAYSAVCGIGACMLLFFGADYVAVVWLCDGRCTLSLRLLAISLPFISMSNVLHGYFTACRRVSKSAGTQIFEQLFKTLVCVCLLIYVVPDGIEYACAALVGGGALAETASFTMAFILYLVDRRRRGRGISEASGDGNITRKLLGITIPVAVAAGVRSGLSTIEHMLIPRGLRANPRTADTALAAYGILCGMTFPIIMFPTAILYSFTGLLIPEFAEASASGDKRRISSMICRSLGMTLVFSIGCAAVMGTSASELGVLIYNSAEAGEFIRIMTPLIPIMYFDHAVDAILKGLGEQLYCMKVNIIDSGLCTLLVWILCPRIGIYGYVVTIYLSEIINVSLSLGRLLRVGGFKMSVMRWVASPVLSASAAVFAAHFIFLNVPCEGWLGVALTVMITASVYLLLLTMTGTLKPVLRASSHKKTTAVT